MDSPVVLLLLLLGIALCYCAVKVILIAANKRYNRQNDIVHSPTGAPRKHMGPIIDQSVPGSRVSRMRYGRKPMSWNGCEVIAVYNAMVLQHRSVSMAELVTQFQRTGAMLGWGYFGSRPAAIGRVLRENHIPYVPITSPAQIKKDGLYIISYWTGRRWLSRLHTVALTCDIRGCTTYNNLPGTVDHRPPSAYVRGGFICGYYLGR